MLKRVGIFITCLMLLTSFISIMSAENMNNLMILQPLGYWNFDEGEGIIAHDSSGNYFDGIINGAVWTEDAISENALCFRGEYYNDYVDLGPHVLDLGFGTTDDFSISAWFKSLQTDVSGMIWNMNHYTGGDPGFKIVQLSTGQLRVEVQKVDIILKSDTIATYNDGERHHTVGIYNGDLTNPTIEIYVDGHFCSSNTGFMSTFYASDFDNVKIGRVGHNVAHQFNGLIDEVSVYDQALTESEIEELYEQFYNHPPDIPAKPSGKTFGKVGIEYHYTTSTVDPDEDQVYYKWDWGDGSFSEWLGPYDSDLEVSASHSWSHGNYEIKVKSKDIHDEESNWSDPLSISMPRNRILHTSSIHRLIERFPNVLAFLKQFMFSIQSLYFN